MKKAFKTLIVLVFLFIIIITIENKKITNKNNILFKTNKEKIAELKDGELTVDNPEFWINRIEDPDLILMNEDEIKVFNEESFKRLDCLYNLEEENGTINQTELINLIQSISIIPKEISYDKNGNILGEDFYNKLIENLNINNVEKENYLRYGLAVNRTNMRTFPTYEPVYKRPGDIEFDQFAETAVYPWEPLIIYSESKDGQWYFGKIYNYIGWIPKKDIAIGEKDEIFKYRDKDPFIIVVNRQVTLDGINFDMGVRIPVKNSKSNKEWIIFIPKRDEEGNLYIGESRIQKSEDFYQGYLPYTKENIIKQAFKFKGEKYGWGGSNNTRDCSAFMMDIFRTFGIMLPRNTYQQGIKDLGKVYEGKEYLHSPGTSLYMPGHTMIYLGEYEGEYYIIHQFAGYYEGEGKNLQYNKVMKTDITTLSIKTSNGETFLEKIYSGKYFQ